MLFSSLELKIIQIDDQTYNLFSNFLYYLQRHFTYTFSPYYKYLIQVNSYKFKHRILPKST